MTETTQSKFNEKVVEHVCVNQNN